METETARSTAGKSRVALHLTLSDFRHQSRSLRMLRALLASNAYDQVHVVALAGDGLPAQESLLQGRLFVRRVDVRVPRRIPGALRHPFQYFFWTLHVLRQACRLRPELLQCKSIEPLPAAVLARALAGASLVYDAAELESEKGKRRFPRAAAFALRTIERLCLRWVSKVLVVSDSIADWYQRTYSIARPTVIRNLPETISAKRESGKSLRAELGLPSESLIFLYLGALTHGRGVSLLLEAAKRLEAGEGDRYVVFMGAGPYEKIVQESARNNPVVRWLPPVPPGDVLRYASDADLGLVLIEDTCLSYRYSLPNKLFEHYWSGVPVLASDLPELREFVRTRRAGFVVPCRSDAVSDFLKGVSRTFLVEARTNMAPPSAMDSWHEEAKRYLEAINAPSKATQSAGSDVPGRS
jgi:glycosyltransferase involved in cell wall biosynthesis